MLLAWLGLEALDLPGRLALVFLALNLAEAALAHLPARWREPH